MVDFHISVTSVLKITIKYNLNASRPSEHPPVRGKNVKTFRWDHRLQIQNLFMAFERFLFQGPNRHNENYCMYWYYIL